MARIKSSYWSYVEIRFGLSSSWVKCEVFNISHCNWDVEPLVFISFYLCGFNRSKRDCLHV